MSENSNQRKCWLPWRMFRIMSDGDVTFCCSNQAVIGNIFRQSFEDIWNSENAVRFRSLIAENKQIEAGCVTCSFWHIFHEYLFDFPTADLPLTPSQTENRSLQFEEFEKGNTHLESKPSLIFVQPSYLCNINCIMCNQKQVRMEGPNSLAVRSNLLAYLDEIEVLPENIILQGGEPLLVPEIIRYLQKIVDEQPNTHITLNTNGLLFHRRGKLLRKLPNLKLNFSVDAGSKKIYEKIRVGGDWDQLVRNIDSAVSISQQADLNWTINIQNVVMKSNIEHLPELVKFGLNHAPDQKIYPVLGIDNETENIFIFNHLLDEVPRWQSSLNEAEHLAEAAGLVEMRRGLQYCRNLLNCGPRLTSDLFAFLKQAMDGEEFLHFYENLAAYKVARVNGFTQEPFDKYFNLNYNGPVNKID